MFKQSDRRNRWNSLLFEIVSGEGSAISEVAEYLTKKTDSSARILKQKIVTRGARPSEANSLYKLDRAIQEVLAAIMEAQVRVSTGGKWRAGREFRRS